MTADPQPVPDAALTAALGGYYHHPTATADADPDVIDGLTAGLAAGLVARGQAVYIAEVIWFEENPVDGRKRIAACTTLDGALSALSGHHIYGGDLVATEVEPAALGTDQARAWNVHERGKGPSDEGFMWITREELKS